MHLKILTFTLDKCYMCNLSRWYDYQLQILLISQLGPPKNVSGFASSPAGGEARAKTLPQVLRVLALQSKKVSDEVVIGNATKVLVQDSAA